MTDTIDTLLGRSSASSLAEPAPSGAVLERILATALRAPDHGRLRPWRFLTVRGAARETLAALVADAVRRREPDAPDVFVEKQRNKFLRAPLVLVLGARIAASPKVPEIEQVMSVAAGTMNVLNALHAEGFGGIWVTGATSYDPAIQVALGFAPPDRLLGFLFIGTPTAVADRPSPRRPDLSDHLADWTVPAA
ncbi:MAG: nitroreductase [Gluconacetobacter diazotrophicus]|nr:nitroreductase [Gluconacetobacter diazotrophicus]